MMHTTSKVLLLVAVASLTACGETPQTLGAGKTDVAPHMGAENPFALPGWKAGDKTSWEQGLKARAQNTQNEYSKSK